METTVTIGEFARLSHLSVVALRHYHDVGLLTPARIDPDSGYRRYHPRQVENAQLIRRLRDLEMPVPAIAEVLAADQPAVRDSAIAAHLERMEASLGKTAQVVSSLRKLLRPVNTPLEVEYRTVPAMHGLGITARVEREHVDQFCQETFPVIYQAVLQSGADPAGPGIGTYSTEFFEQDVGEVSTVVPLAFPLDSQGPVQSMTLPSGRFAISVHTGDFNEIDRTYGSLGGYVAEHSHGAAAPIREHYLIGPNHTENTDQFRTEIWWPITTPPITTQKETV